MVDRFRNGWAGAKTCCCVRLSAFDTDGQIFKLDRFTLQLGSPLQEFFGFPGGSANNLKITRTFDREGSDWFACFCNAVSNDFGPVLFDPDHDYGRYVRVAACSNHCTEVELKIF